MNEGRIIFCLGNQPSEAASCGSCSEDIGLRMERLRERRTFQLLQRSVTMTLSRPVAENQAVSDEFQIDLCQSGKRQDIQKLEPSLQQQQAWSGTDWSPWQPDF